VAAVSAYHADHGKYPAALDHLVPDYLTDIPLCAYRITESRYKYIADPTQPMLVWVKTPPFGQNIYHFDSKSWTYVD
jgi:hypothetical protein